MQRNIVYNARHIDGIAPRWAEIAKRTRRQSSSSRVGGIDSECTVNTLTDNTGHYQFYSVQYDPQCQWICSITEEKSLNNRTAHL